MSWYIPVTPLYVECEHPHRIVRAIVVRRFRYRYDPDSFYAIAIVSFGRYANAAYYCGDAGEGKTVLYIYTPSRVHDHGAVVREYIEYGIAQSRSQ